MNEEPESTNDVTAHDTLESEPLESRVLVMLLRCAHAVSVELDAELREDELTTHQLLALRALARADGEMAVRSLAAALGCNRSSASEALRRAEKYERFERARADGDRRSIVVRLTERGEEALDDGRRTLQEMMLVLSNELSADERAQLHDLLRRILFAAGFRRMERFWGDTLRLRRLAKPRPPRPPGEIEP